MSERSTIFRDLVRANVEILRSTGKYGSLKTAADLEQYRQASIENRPLAEPEPFETKATGWCGMNSWQYADGKNGSVKLFTINHDGTPYLQVGGKEYKGQDIQVYRCVGCCGTFDTFKALKDHTPDEQR